MAAVLLVWLACIDGGSIGLGAACPPLVPVPPAARVRDPVDGYPAPAGPAPSGTRVQHRYRTPPDTGLPRHPATSGDIGWAVARGMPPISDQARTRDGIDIRPDAMYPISIADPAAPGNCRYRFPACLPISAGCLQGTDIGHRSGGHTGLRDIDGHMTTRDIDCVPAAVAGTRTGHGGQIPGRFDSGCVSGPA